MNLSTLASCILFFFLIAQSGTPQWKEYTSREGKFTVLLPGEPTTGLLTLVEDSPANITRVTNLKTPIGVYHIAYFDTPEMVTESEKVQQLFNTTRDRIIQRHSLRLQAETEKWLQGYPGRSLRMITSNGKPFLTRIYLVRQRVYYLYAESYLDQQESNDTDKFFESFKPTPLTDDEIKNLASNSKTESNNNIPGTVKGLVLPGIALKKVTPSYPKEARKARITGSVLVQVLISEEGQVISAEIREGPEELREAALEAAKQWTFKPTIFEGRTVKVQGILTFNFALQ